MKMPRINPRLAGCAAAIVCMVIDDLPRPEYGTFHDPGASLMLSIVFGNFVALGFYRQWDSTSIRWMGFGLFFKILCQPLFYVRDAALIDLTTLLAFHFIVAILAVNKNGASSAALRILAALGAYLVGSSRNPVGKNVASAGGRLIKELQ